ncbi:MAG: acyltransferase [Bacteroidales bacterium]|nr:acyltransferase [Bacteroidales bacterium]
MNPNSQQRLFQISSPEEFNETALRIFREQYLHNPVYRRFAGNFISRPEKIRALDEVPFMPVELFKTHKISDTGKNYDRIFSSSGTGGVRSRHYVADISLYKRSLIGSFIRFYGNPGDYCFLALLPSYLEREDSSLVYMVSKLMEVGKHPGNGFFLHDHEALAQRLWKQQKEGSKTILIGVTFALLDFVSVFQCRFPSLIVMETGGMKGRGVEMVREEVHERLCQGFGVKKIHSEYGMTELLSQAYSDGDGRFKAPPWMRVLIRDPYDPFSFLGQGKTGLISVADLANIHSCSFVATQDIGRIHKDGSFEVLGRMDHSDIRGCNLLYV